LIPQLFHWAVLGLNRIKR